MNVVGTWINEVQVADLACESYTGCAHTMYTYRKDLLPILSRQFEYPVSLRLTAR